MSTPVSELYQDPVQVERFHALYNHGMSLPASVLFEEIDGVITAPDPVAQLDQLHDEDKSLWLTTADVVTALPAETILESYGPETLAWAAANAKYSGQTTTLRRSLRHHLGIDDLLFEKAREWALRKHGSSKGKEVLRGYNMIESIRGNGLRQLDIPSFVTAHPRDTSITISEARANHYKVAPLISTPRCAAPTGWTDNVLPPGKENLHYEIYLDAPSGFALTYKGLPNAVVALAPAKADTLMIHQLQGIKATNVDTGMKVSARGLAPLDWEALMVDIATTFAKNGGYKRIAIEGAAQNRWVRTIERDTGKPHLDKEFAAARYDGTAKRLGFTQGKNGNWYKSLN